MNKDLERSSPVYSAVGTPTEIQDGGKHRQVQASFWKLLLIAFPRMAINMAWSAQWAAIGPYLSTMLPNSAVQAIQFIGPVCGILVAPTIGALSDRTTSKYGRRRPYIFCAAVGSVICYILMGYTRELGDALGDYGDGSAGTPTSRTYTAILTAIFYLWMDITVNLVQTPIFLLISDFAGDRQTLGSALGQGWATIGSILVAVYIDIWGAAYLTLHWFLGMLSIVMAICAIVVCVVANEEPMPKDPEDKSSACSAIAGAFGQIYHGLRTLPYTLIIYSIVFFCVCFGFTAYNGNKGQFFGLEVYGGTSTGADACDPCSAAQTAYNRGVQVAGGRADLTTNIVGYVFSWMLPFLVKQFGGQWVIIISLVPQVLLLALAYTTSPNLAVFFVVIVSFTQVTYFAMIVPLIIHVMGNDVDIGVLVGAINSANCFGQLIDYAVGTVTVDTSMGYKLPVLLGGIVSTIGLLLALAFFRVKMHTM